jgi:hypothetical protein
MTVYFVQGEHGGPSRVVFLDGRTRGLTAS